MNLKIVLKKSHYILVFFSVILLSMIIGYFIVYLLNSKTSFVYFSGVILQVFGLSIMLMHISKLNKDFDKKNKLNPLNLIPFNKNKRLIVSDSITFNSSIKAKISTKRKPKDDSIESHIEALREDFKSEIKQLESTIAKKEEDIKQFKKTIQSKIESIEQEHANLKSKLASVMTETNDWLYLSYMWTLIGLLIVIFSQ